MAPKKDKQNMNGFSLHQEQHDPSNMVFRNSMNGSSKRSSAGQGGGGAPLSAPKYPKSKGSGDMAKRPMNQDRTPWK